MIGHFIGTTMRASSHVTAVFVLIASLAILRTSAEAQVYSGQVTVIDGDTLQMTGERIRLFGIDAPEKAQTCSRDGQPWPCGAQATSRMADWTGNQTLECTQQDRDEYGRVVATCTAGGIDLSERLARNGLAIALPHFTDRYLAAQQYAHDHHLGIWAGTFDTPSAYRASHPRQYISQPPGPKSPPLQQTATPPSRTNLYFRSCRDARAAGYLMMRRGEPGYRIGLDGDLDGVACEPPPRRH